MKSSDNTAVVVMRDGYQVVEQADDILLVSDELWRQMEGTEFASPELGHAVIDRQVLTFGTPDQGLGRLSYRWLAFIPQAGTHVLERIKTLS